MQVSAGQLRHKVTLQAQQETRSEYGEIIVDWVTLARVWAHVAPQSGREYFAAQQVQSEVSTRVTIRYRDDVNATMRLQHRGQTYRIEAVMADDGSGRDHLTLMCSEVSP
ncbi:head-tail adaptor protein [Salinisphaera orenii MK-B5]|uniref:Head-tail adaptor protein n=1 Tax=Salinisphaera orenii MK-B5 TaxID=856730 RepID=A0A423PXW6_9GAMM|nr:phage head closure protein [Salinisphaera orenii]ROO30431.1 head-tail adaptor protein [Salinisphaera orenii MK-B5]